MIDFPNDEIEFRGAWSSCAGTLGGYQHAARIVSEAAKEAFIRQNDVMADRLRRLALELQVLADNESKKLKLYIEESDKRRDK